MKSGYERALVIHKNGKMRVIEVGRGHRTLKLPDAYFTPEIATVSFDPSVEKQSIKYHRYEREDFVNAESQATVFVHTKLTPKEILEYVIFGGRGK